MFSLLESRWFPIHSLPKFCGTPAVCQAAFPSVGFRCEQVSYLSALRKLAFWREGEKKEEEEREGGPSNRNAEKIN